MTKETAKRPSRTAAPTGAKAKRAAKPSQNPKSEDTGGKGEAASSQPDASDARQARILPFIRDLNPLRDDLPGLLTVLNDHQGDRVQLVDAIYKKWKLDKARTGFTKHSINANTLSSLGPENLQILDGANRLTELGTSLYKARNKPNVLKRQLGTHLLRHRGGWQFVRALRVLTQRSRRPKRQDVAGFLAEKYGIEEWRDLNNISSLHNFLSWCGVVSNYTVNETEAEQMLGTSLAEVGEFERFPLESREYFRALVSIGGSATAAQVREATEALLRRPLDPHQVPSRMKPLVEAGHVKHQGRRGQRTGVYSVSDDRRADALATIARDLLETGTVPDEVFMHDVAWVVERLFNEKLSKDEKGRSLEVLAAMVCWRLGLRRLQVRERKPQEIDVTAEYLGVGFQEWSAQCKAYGQSSVRSVDLLRELGLAILHRYSVLLFITTSDFTPDAVHTANEISRTSAIQVIMLNGKSLRAIARTEESLYSLVRERSEEIRSLRKRADASAPSGADAAGIAGTEADRVRFLPKGDDES